MPPLSRLRHAAQRRALAAHAALARVADVDVLQQGPPEERPAPPPRACSMTVIKLKSGGLWVHAPVAPTRECLRLLKVGAARRGRSAGGKRANAAWEEAQGCVCFPLCDSSALLLPSECLASSLRAAELP